MVFRNNVGTWEHTCHVSPNYFYKILSHPFTFLHWSFHWVLLVSSFFSFFFLDHLWRIAVCWRFIRYHLMITLAVTLAQFHLSTPDDSIVQNIYPSTNPAYLKKDLKIRTHCFSKLTVFSHQCQDVLIGPNKIYLQFKLTGIVSIVICLLISKWPQRIKTFGKSFIHVAAILQSKAEGDSCEVHWILGRVQRLEVAYSAEVNLTF